MARAAKLAWWNWAGHLTAYQVVLLGSDDREYLLENPDWPREWPGQQVLRILRIPPHFDRYGAETVANKATRELAEMDPEAFASRWKVPLSAL